MASNSHSRADGNPVSALNTDNLITDNLITDNIDVWTSAIQKRNSQGRGSNSKVELVGIKKLRELILELAVRGKLVPQEPNDEPASVLLEKIAAEKAQLVADKKIKKQKALPEITDQEKQFEVPEGWEWCYLQDVSTYIQRGKGPKYDENGQVKVISQKCIQWSGFNLEPARRISDESLDKYQEERFLQPRDLLWNSTGTGTAGRINLLDHVENKTLVADSHVTVIRTIYIDAAFIKNFITAPGVQYRIEPGNENSLVSGTTNQVELNTSAVMSLEIPIPPLAEQHRIVAKVDELMALCDQLEQQTEQSLTAHQTLVEVLLATLTDSTSAGDFQSNWQCISEHFDALFTTEHSIEQLKQTILQLAVMGKLVPQNPSDEPASKLLEKIAEEKAQLIKDKKIKKQKPLPEITDEEKPFELPNGWEWCNLEDTALNSEAGWSPKCLPTPRETNRWGVLKVSAVTWGIYNPNENKELPSGLEPRPQYEVQSGDFLISRANTAELVAKAVIVPIDSPKKLMMSDKIIRFVLSPKVEGAFITLVNNSLISRAYYSEVAGGTSSSMKNVSREQIRRLVIALPPLAEQHRIVAKVDELMALCDQLKTRLCDAQTTQHHLADAVVENALD
ncbi:restriction endonuclease subunit S [Psychrosphaera sp. 1_MG-2023]|uniref:restriction endonuclease subunit S n=1 Tax=Psychrosphaera sp. 1_MG-2023 TaxID=3062643 RepID=UPI0026E154BA|nr:restriction endonuclease subunit S [Psychrosphaera sp. 1_MG-2023]MDO6719860.1 restriction endonuclease subunit S [Psychrosphaera sp. 1_MG-2023]